MEVLKEKIEWHCWFHGCYLVKKCQMKKFKVRKAFNEAHGIDIESNPDKEIPLPVAV